MKKLLLISILVHTAGLLAGFGIQVGGYSPTEGLDDNNGVLIGANIEFKFAVVGLKIEGFYVDSSGRYANDLGEEFGAADIDIEAILAADLMFYPVGTTFFLQAGVNYASLDASGLDDLNYDEVIDNELGVEAGLGVMVLDKLLIQGKVMFTPDAIDSSVADTVKDLDEDLLGFMVSVGWQF